jgi:hypothetical protein|tara:strand:- start:2079 stop:2381 length:303 start_codon:yes stop_codon:yes gene_type:complete
MNMAWTVGQLRHILEAYDDDTVIVSTSHYGDRVNSELAHGFIDINERTIVYSDYHRDWKFSDDTYDYEEYARVCVLEMASASEVRETMEEHDCLKINKEE